VPSTTVASCQAKHRKPRSTRGFLVAAPPLRESAETVGSVAAFGSLLKKLAFPGKL